MVDQDALVEALEKNVIAGAGLDVMTPEPLPLHHPLMKLHNCGSYLFFFSHLISISFLKYLLICQFIVLVLIPHIGSATNESRAAMSALTANNILAALRNQPMPAEITKIS